MDNKYAAAFAGALVLTPNIGAAQTVDAPLHSLELAVASCDGIGGTFELKNVLLTNIDSSTEWSDGYNGPGVENHHFSWSTPYSAHLRDLIEENKEGYERRVFLYENEETLDQLRSVVEDSTSIHNDIVVDITFEQRCVTEKPLGSYHNEMEIAALTSVSYALTTISDSWLQDDIHGLVYHVITSVDRIQKIE